MNNFTRDLTMNVQDIQKSCIIPWDLMPEGERRVEFTPIPTCRPWMPYRKSKSWLPRQLSGGPRAVAITDHGMQSFPHGFKAAKKAGIQLIYGMEANIVEDKVPLPVTRWIWTSMKRPMWSLTWKRRDFQPFIMT